jgi:hypothetical protein
MKIVARYLFLALLGIIMFLYLCDSGALSKLFPLDDIWDGRFKVYLELFKLDALNFAGIIITLYACFQMMKKVKPIFGEKTAEGIMWIYFGQQVLTIFGYLMDESWEKKGIALVMLIPTIALYLFIKKFSIRESSVSDRTGPVE